MVCRARLRTPSDAMACITKNKLELRCKGRGNDLGISMGFVVIFLPTLLFLALSFHLNHQNVRHQNTEADRIV